MIVKLRTVVLNALFKRVVHYHEFRHALLIHNLYFRALRVHEMDKSKECFMLLFSECPEQHWHNKVHSLAITDLWKYSCYSSKNVFKFVLTLFCHYSVSGICPGQITLDLVLSNLVNFQILQHRFIRPLFCSLLINTQRLKLRIYHGEDLAALDDVVVKFHPSWFIHKVKNFV